MNIEPPHCAVPTLDYRNAGREAVGTAATGVNRVGRRGLKEAPEYRDVLLRADRHASWLAGLVRLAAPPVSSQETERTDTLDAAQNAA